jgi:hypothetical protein
VIRERLADLSPLLGSDVELPEIAELIVLVILASEDEEGLSRANGRVGITLERASLGRGQICC